MNKPKTRKQRKKELKLKMEEKRKEYGKRKKMKVHDVYKIKTMNKEINAEEKKIARKMAKRNEQKEIKKSLPASLTGHKFEEQDLDLKVCSCIFYALPCYLNYHKGFRLHIGPIFIPLFHALNLV